MLSQQGLLRTVKRAETRPDMVKTHDRAMLNCL